MAAELFLLPFRPALDLNALPIPGAALFFYATGTSTPQEVFADDALTVSLGYIVEANGAGVWPSIYLDNAKIYRAVLRDAEGAVLNEVDPYVPGVVDNLAPEIALSAARAIAAASIISLINGGYFEEQFNPPPADAAEGQTYLATEGGRAALLRNDAGTGVVVFELSTLTSTATALAGKANNNLAGLGAVNTVTTQDSITYPVGNELESRTQWSFTHADLHDDKREFIHSYGAVFSRGSDDLEGDSDHKCLFYWGVRAREEARKVWVLNPLLTLEPSLTNLKYANVAEFDINNFDRDYGAADGLAGLSEPAVYGVTISGATTDAYSVTAGLGIIGHGSPAIFERGFIVGPLAVKQAAFDDYSAATSSYRDLGTHSIGLNMAGAYTTAAMVIPNAASVSSKLSGGTVARMLNLDASNNLRVGDPAMANISMERTVIPNSDNTFQLGASGNRWSSVWSANGAIQTSDASLKTDFAEVDQAKAGLFFDAITPKSYRWIVGGKVPIYATEQREVQVGTKTEMVKVGKPGSEVEVEATVPIMEMQDVEVVTGYEDVPGQRTHYGFLACDVKAAVDAAGFDDFAGYVVAEDGTEAIRPDQILALAVTEIKALRARVAALEGIN